MPRVSGGKTFQEYGLTVSIAVGIALLIRLFVLEAYRIPTPTMRPTLEPGDTIFVSKVRFDLHVPWSAAPIPHGPPPRRGEVVLFSLPAEPRRDYIKRIVGVPGDRIQLRQGKILFNGTPLIYEASRPDASCGDELWPDGLRYGVCRESPLIEDSGPELVPEGFVFVLGDLRAKAPGPRPSDDKRVKSWGLIPLSLLKGKALWIWMSVRPRGIENSSDWFPQIRFERLFRKISGGLE